MSQPRKRKRAPSATEQFEEALRRQGTQKYHLRLFVTGVTPKSVEAIEQVRQMCDKYLKGRYELEIVDLYKEPDAARKDQVIAAPTLIKLLPLPMRKFVGDMARQERLLAGLDIQIVTKE